MPEASTDQQANIKYDAAAFLDLVMNMRELQRQFFAGKRSVVNEAKKAEQQVYTFINKALSDAGWTPTNWEKRPKPGKQKGLF